VDRVETGQEFDVERVDRGDYRLVRRTAPPNEAPLTGYSPVRRRTSSSRSDSESTDAAVKYLVDANVLSEPTKPTPDPRSWRGFRAHEPDIAVDPVILGELRFGILTLPRGRKRAALERWFDAGVGRLHCLAWDRGHGAEMGGGCWRVFAQPEKACRSRIASSRRLRSSTVWRSPREIAPIS